MSTKFAKQKCKKTNAKTRANCIRKHTQGAGEMRGVMQVDSSLIYTILFLFLSAGVAPYTIATLLEWK